MRPAEGWAGGHKAGKRSLEAAQTCIVPLRPWGRSWMAVAELPQDGKALPPWDGVEATPPGQGSAHCVLIPHTSTVARCVDLTTFLRHHHEGARGLVLQVNGRPGAARRYGFPPVTC